MILALLTILAPGVYDLGAVHCDGGIGVEINAPGVTIRGGSIEGCEVGVNSPDHPVTVEGVTFTANGIGVNAQRATVRRSSFDGIGEEYAVGVNIRGGLVEDSVIRDLRAAETVGVLIGSNASDVVVRGNRIEAEYGVWIARGSSDVLIEGNDIDGPVIADVTERVTVTGNRITGIVHLVNCTGCSQQ